MCTSIPDIKYVTWRADPQEDRVTLGHWPSRLGGVGGGVLLALALVSGCTGGGASAELAEAASEPPVIAPGEPGEEARTLSPEAARQSAGDAYGEPNAADRAFVAMMIDHHEQALVMTGLAERHATDPAVGRLAERIARAQEPEIDVMDAWLGENGGGENHGHGGHGGHASVAMPGMATEAQLDELRDARGADFDGLFLDLMIAHHEGAVTMATDETAHGSDNVVIEMATELAATQGAEIDRLESLR
jgi:uncharacterized protein (DUF305 family)